MVARTAGRPGKTLVSGPQCALVVAASGGIGAAMLRQLRLRLDDQQLIAAARDPDRIDPEFRGQRLALDLSEPSSIKQCGQQLAALGVELTLVFNAAGLLHDDVIAPERQFKDIDHAALMRAYAVNAAGPIALTAALVPRLAADRRAVIAHVSAKVGSISDNGLGGWYAYRMSKAALNMGVKNASIELKRRHPHAICVALHPGTVATALSQPFLGRVRHEVFDVDQAAAQLLAVIDGLDSERSGQLIDYAGHTIDP